eukprot:TRINITY_DN4509_c0_g1_i1.p1 TRINITY_DN4509_c0_g1~~TRINITY_DN4509_c0_g1_i1.p1  ORF type:complete len:124 (-),score=5.57 TRINITY_DN4509_c0_g1_i1:230-601(-)
MGTLTLRSRGKKLDRSTREKRVTTRKYEKFIFHLVYFSFCFSFSPINYSERYFIQHNGHNEHNRNCRWVAVTTLVTTTISNTHSTLRWSPPVGVVGYKTSTAIPNSFFAQCIFVVAVPEVRSC